MKICLAASVRGVCVNSIIGKHLGRLGVTKEHIMCANAIICTQLGQAEPIMSANAIICTHLGGLASGSAGSSGNWVSPKSTSCAQILLFARNKWGVKIWLAAVGGRAVRREYYLQAVRAVGWDQRAHYLRKCYYLHAVKGGWSTSCPQMLLFARRGGAHETGRGWTNSSNFRRRGCILIGNRDGVGSSSQSSKH